MGRLWLVQGCWASTMNTHTVEKIFVLHMPFRWFVYIFFSGICICTFGYIHVYTCVEVRGQPIVLFLRSHPFYFVRLSLTDLELAKEARLTMSPRESPPCLSTPQCWDCKHTPPYTTFFFFFSWTLGLEFMFSCFHGKYFPIIPVPNVQILESETGFLFTGVSEVAPLSTKACATFVWLHDTQDHSW